MAKGGDGVRAWLDEAARHAGFASVHVTDTALPGIVASRLDDFIEAGHHGDMTWLADTAQRRHQPGAMWSAARSAIVLAANYTPDHDPMRNIEAVTRGNISVYARGRDYHDVIKGRLKTIAGQLAAKSGAEVKVFVDTAPLMEKPLAAMAGAGWQGKHTNLVSRRLGSWFFLGVILTSAELERDTPETDHCGSCTRCLDVCPTKAFVAPYRLDARRCISYLTIEHKGQIPRALRAAVGNRIFGCDDCLAVCPWNKYAVASSEAKFRGGPMPGLGALLGLDEKGFRAKFAGGPVRRAGFGRFMRNVLVAAGNSGDAGLVPRIEPWLGREGEIVRGMAVWAIRRLADAAACGRIQEAHRRIETCASVLLEWDGELDRDREPGPDEAPPRD